MTVGRDPADAPRRTDLTFLRHRSRRPAPSTVAAPQNRAPAAPKSTSTSASTSASTPEPKPTATAAAPSSAPGTGSTSLDLGATSVQPTVPPAPPAPPRPAPPIPTPPSPTTPRPPAGNGGGTDLTLSSAPAGSTTASEARPASISSPTPRAGPTTGNRHQPLHVRHARRLGEGITRLVPATPTVTLNRIQSGAGHLDLALVRSRNDAAFSLACAYELGNDTEGVVRVGGDLSAPPGELLPLLRMRDHPEGETLNIDLRQVTHLRRALLFAYSPAGNPLEPEGLLTFTTYGGARIELPVSGAHRAGCLAIATIYNVFGELVIRAEMEHFEGSAQVVTEAFGYERWISTASGSASASPGPPPPPQD